MASSSSSLAKKMAPKTIVFKYQGTPKKSHFQDGNSKIRDYKLGHIDWNTFLTICNKPRERFTIVSTLIRSGFVNATSHPTFVQSSELIMALT